MKGKTLKQQNSAITNSKVKGEGGICTTVHSPCKVLVCACVLVCVSALRSQVGRPHFVHLHESLNQT